MILQLGVIAPYEIVKGLSYPGVILDKLSEVTGGANESPHTGDGFRVAHLGDLLDTFPDQAAFLRWRFRVQGTLGSP